MWCLRAFLPGLEAAAPADVVNVVSVAGVVAFPPSGPYSASKHAQLAFSRAVAAELRPRRIRVHTVKPGFVETEGFPQGGLPAPLRRLVVGPEKIAQHVLNSIERGRGETTVPLFYAPAAPLQALLPNVFARVLAVRRGRSKIGGAMTWRDFGVNDVMAVAELRAALRQFLRRSERVARQSGLTPQRYLLLLMIKGAPGGDEQSTVTQLSERLQLAQSTVTELVRRAEEAGLVAREQSQTDARVAHLRLTAEGERRLMLSFTELETERAQLRDAFAQLDAALAARPSRASPCPRRAGRAAGAVPISRPRSSSRRPRRPRPPGRGRARSRR